MPGPGPGTMPCPYCTTPMECDTADVGIGFQQCGPYHCDKCGASEVGPERASATLDEDEQRTGFYKGGRVSPYANAVGGTLVDHQTAKRLYELGLLDRQPGQSLTYEQLRGSAADQVLRPKGFIITDEGQGPLFERSSEDGSRVLVVGHLNDGLGPVTLLESVYVYPFGADGDAVGNAPLEYPSLAAYVATL